MVFLKKYSINNVFNILNRIFMFINFVFEVHLTKQVSSRATTSLKKENKFQEKYIHICGIKINKF